MKQFFFNHTADPLPQLYYGRIVRTLFFVAGLILLFLILIDKDLFYFYVTIGILEVLALIIFAAFTGRRHWPVIFIDTAIALTSFLLFEYFAIARYNQVEYLLDPVFFFRQLLALIFLIALYFSTKTTRGYVEEKVDE
ncbi:MAG: hypothetical protein WC757_04560 [Candidatus Paceibacterota bacterium]